MASRDSPAGRSDDDDDDGVIGSDGIAEGVGVHGDRSFARRRCRGVEGVAGAAAAADGGVGGKMRSPVGLWRTTKLSITERAPNGDPPAESGSERRRFRIHRCKSRTPSMTPHGR